MKKNLCRILTLAVCLVLTLGLLAACGSSGGNTPSGGGSTPSGGNTTPSGSNNDKPASDDVELRYVVHGPNTMTVFSSDPALDYTGQINQGNGTCETLMVLDDDTKEVKPLLATEWKQTDDTT